MATHVLQEPAVRYFLEVVKAGSIKDAAAKLNVALRAALQDDAVKARIAELSSEIVPMDKVTPESLRTLLTAETAKWGKVIKASGVQAE